MSWPIKAETECCDAFRTALEAGTDSEEYMSLIEFKKGDWEAGNCLPPMVFCPWCGAKLEPPKPGAATGHKY